jgi:hypothetical protein
MKDPTGSSSSATHDSSGQPEDAGNCSAGDDGADLELMIELCAKSGYLEQDNTATAAAACMEPATPSSPAAGTCPWACSTKMSQIDLTPTLAHMLGVPIPFGNLGRLPPHLFWVLGRSRGQGRMNGTHDWLKTYAAALQRNTQQVRVQY